MEKDYAESIGSSPRTRDIDCDDPSWQEQPLNYRVKFMCSYGGKITPRSHDNQLTYTGGHTKILAVDRIIKFADLLSKLQSYCDSEIVFKYQLPGEDLDALISITNEEDLEHMMEEYDRLYRLSTKPPPRLRLFLFPRKNYSSNESNEALGFPRKDYGSNDSSEPRKSCSSNDSNDTKPNKKWLADALESSGAAIGGQAVSVRPVASTTPPPTKDSDIQGIIPTDVSAKSDSGKDDRNTGESVISQTLSQAEIQRQIQELQRMQIANHEQAGAFHGIPFAPPPPPVYLFPSHAGMYHPSVGQNYYTMQRVPHPDMYAMGAHQQKIIGGGIGVAAETGYTHVAYDSAGRQVYYTAAPGNVMNPSFATAVGTGVGAGVDSRPVVTPVNVDQEAKAAATAPV
ncbi:hypothetical protein ACHQM5_023121 [Ranunculus cassubicifolius]